MATDHPHARLIHDFYEAFARKDADGMVECYHPDVCFSDPVFQDLRGDRAGGMWRMLCARAKDLEIEHSGVVADEHTGSAHWEAKYTFAATGRKVHNCIDASFRFEDGKIIDHRDHFAFWLWTRMALGPLGWVLGWSPIVQGKVRAQAGEQLDRYLSAKRS